MDLSACGKRDGTVKRVWEDAKDDMPAVWQQERLENASHTYQRHFRHCADGRKVQAVPLSQLQSTLLAAPGRRTQFTVQPELTSKADLRHWECSIPNAECPISKGKRRLRI